MVSNTLTPQVLTGLTYFQTQGPQDVLTRKDFNPPIRAVPLSYHEPQCC